MFEVETYLGLQKFMLEVETDRILGFGGLLQFGVMPN